MDCKDLEALLSQRALAELTPEERAAVAAHVDACDACREKWGLDQQSQVLHDDAKALRPAASVKEAVMAKLGGEEPRAEAESPKEGAAKPTRLGGFELIARIGQGGMGAVFKARQLSMDRIVALKVLPQRLAKDETFVQRFLREARSAARLHHAHIVQAIDVGQAGGYYYFAMEFVDGETLDAVVRRDGPLDPARALDLMKQVTSALAAAHEAGIVHRDIKPSNLMIDKKGEVRVTDFGLAKRTEGDVEVTADGSVVGTPAYVAPEMAKGGDADARSDLYSLGSTFFCALAARPPFEGKNFSEVLIKQVNEPAPPLASLAPRVDRRLCHIIDRLLRKAPEGRYPSANALLDDLNGLGKLQSVAAAARAEGRAMIAEAPTLEMSEGRRREREARIEAQRPRRSRTTLIAMGAIVAILAIVGIVVATRRPPERSKTVREGKEGVTAKTPEAAKKIPVVVVDDAEAKRKAAEVAEKERIAKARKVEPKTLPPPKTKTPEAKVPVLASVSFTAPSESKGLAAVSEGDGKFTTAEREGKLALYQEANNPNQSFLYFRAADDFAKLFQADTGRTALVTITLLDTAPGAVDINYDSHPVEPGEPEDKAVWRPTPGHDLRGTGQWTEVKFELPGARFGHRQQSAGADFRLCHNVALSVHQVTVAAIEEERPPEVPAQLEKGLAVAFYAGQNHDRFVVAKPASCVNSDWGLGAPAPNVPEDGFSTRFVGWLYIPEAGEYTFLFSRDDGARLYLDGKLIIDEWTETHGLGDPASVRLGAGWRRLWVEHMDVNHDASIHLYWRRGDREGLVPRTLLYCEREMLERIRRDPTQDPFAGLTPQTPAKAPDDRVEVAPPPKETAAEAAAAAYARESDKLWALFKARDYAAADKVLLNLPKVANLREVMGADQEALALLKEFWAAVEKGVATRKGTVSIAGALGNVTGVENGVITLQTGKGPVTRRIEQLTAKQALTYAAVALKDDERSRLAEALFRIAEAEDAALADKALAAAGKPPGLSCYKDRLAALTLGAAEVAARKAWAEIEASVKPKPTKAEAQRLLTLLDAFETAHGKTKLFAAVRDKLADLRAQAQPGPKPTEWVSLFDGESLDGWQVVQKFEFPPHVGTGEGGRIKAGGGRIVFEPGHPVTGMSWTREFPSEGYELSVEAMRMAGNDSFCAVRFPLGDSQAGLLVGAWGHRFVALDVVDGRFGGNQVTIRQMDFENGRWYRIGLRVTEERIEAWIDKEKVVDLERAGHTFGATAQFNSLKPLGLGTNGSAGAMRNIRLRLLKPQAAEAPRAGEWQSLFDGKTLKGWSVVKQFQVPANTGNGQPGKVHLEDGRVILGMGRPVTGIVLTGQFPKTGYEVSLQAMRVVGGDCFCDIVFPFRDSYCSLDIGGWGGMVVGLDRVDDRLCVDNITTKRMSFQSGRWYQITLRVTEDRIEATIDQEKVVDLPTAGHSFSCRGHRDALRPFGISTWQASGAVRNIRLRRIEPGAAEAPKAGE